MVPLVGSGCSKYSLPCRLDTCNDHTKLGKVAAFLQADVMGRKFTTLQTEWKNTFMQNKEIHPWLDVPLLLKNSLYGDELANQA
jgi:hypothetical protein